MAGFCWGWYVRFSIISVLLLGLAGSQAVAQYTHLQFRHITPEDGLSQGVVTSILKDSHGFVWMTTYDGINRFDGAQVLSNQAIAPGLGFVSATVNIIEDSKGDIWLGSIEGLIKFDYSQNRFFMYSLPEEVSQDGKRANDPLYPVAERDGIILCSTTAYPRCYIFDSREESFTHFFIQVHGLEKGIEPSSFPKEVTRFSDIISLQWTDKERGQFVSWMEEGSDQNWHWVSENLTGVRGEPFNTTFSGKDFFLQYHFYLGHAEQSGLKLSNLYRFNIESRKLTPIYQANFEITDYKRKDGFLYAGSRTGGLHIIDEKTGRELGQITYDPGKPDGLMSNYINALTIEDHQLWLSSWGKGVDYAYLEDPLFTPHFPASEAERHHTSNFIRGIVEDQQGHFWCNVFPTGIIELDAQFRYVGMIPGTENMNCSAIWLDAHDHLFFGERGLWMYSIAERKLERVRQREGLPQTYCDRCDFHYFTHGQSNQLFAASLGGVHALDTEHHVLYGVCDHQPECSEFQQFTYQDRQGHFYAYTASYGLQVYRHSGDDLHKIFSFEEKFIPRHAFEENDSLLWIGTTGGLLQFNTQSLKVIRWYTTNDGLPNNTVYAIAPDRFGKLWMSTNQGLSCLDLKTCAIQSFTDYPGQQGIEYNRHSMCVTRDGRILFGGINGITAVHPASLDNQTTRPVVQFTSITSDEEINPFDYNHPSIQKVVKAGTSLMEFHFVGIDYFNSTRCRLRYKMEGVDADWKETENPSSARYLNLKPGRYVFTVSAADSFGSWTGEPKSFYFQIKAFWWQTLWFKVLVLLSGIALMYVWIRLWLAHKWNIQRSELEKQLAILQEHERISADLHDDIGSTLSSISVYSELADKYYTSRPEKSHEIVHTISVQTRELMTRIEDIIWSLKPHHPEKTTIKTRLQDYALELLSGKNVGYTIEADPAVDDLIKDPFLRKNILLIMKEAINNAAKYSQASMVHIGVIATEEWLRIKVVDNGIGFETQTMSSGNGLGNMRKRATDIGGEFSVQSIPGTGTTLTIDIPMTNIRHS